MKYRREDVGGGCCGGRRYCNDRRGVSEEISAKRSGRGCRSAGGRFS
jgi:hypothetical protein